MMNDVVILGQITKQQKSLAESQLSTHLYFITGRCEPSSHDRWVSSKQIIVVQSLSENEGRYQLGVVCGGHGVV
jgi:hypothetical protein